MKLKTEENLLFSKISPVASSKENCPFQFRPFQSSCYLVSPSKETRETAAAACESLGGHLVDITTQAEQTFLAYLLAVSGEGTAWFGLMRYQPPNQTSTLKWSDGTTLDTDEQWHDHVLQVDNQTPEECFRIEGSTWNVTECTSELSYICEREGRWMIWFVCLFFLVLFCFGGEGGGIFDGVIMDRHIIFNRNGYHLRRHQPLKILDGHPFHSMMGKWP